MKFGIKEGVITFEIGQNSLSFNLTKNDDKEWKSILKKHLNQKGFHETFKPIKKIGKGNFASVYLVERIENKCKYAVKAFSK
jgi:serine/threonine protein kinase